MSQTNGWALMRSMTKGEGIKDVTLPQGTGRRVLGYARGMRGLITGFLVLVAISSMTVVAPPLLLQRLVDDGVIPGDRQVVTTLALLVAAVAVVEAVTTLKIGRAHV